MPIERARACCARVFLICVICFVSNPGSAQTLLVNSQVNAALWFGWAAWRIGRAYLQPARPETAAAAFREDSEAGEDPEKSRHIFWTRSVLAAGAEGSACVQRQGRLWLPLCLSVIVCIVRACLLVLIFLCLRVCVRLCL
jgi:hypothetical protein